MVSRRRLLLGGMTLPVLGALSSVPRQVPTAASRTVATSGAWCWFGDPRAVHLDGEHQRTYVGYVDGHGHVKVAQYDHRTGQLTSTTVASGLPVDDHSNPSFVVRPDRRIVVFWSGHNGPAMCYRRSVRPEDTSEWGPIVSVPVNTLGDNGYTYPNPAQLSAEEDALYLFWRGGDFNPTFSVATGRGRWSPARTLVSVPGQRPYLKVASNERDTLHFAFTDGHPRNVNTSIYYMHYRDGYLYRAGGELIGPMGTPVTPAQASLVYDATRPASRGRAWIHDIAIAADGHPVLTYATLPADADHRYRYARWTGARWFDRELTAAGDSISEDPAEPHYSGGITLDSTDPSTLLMSRQIDGINEIARWRTHDLGGTWIREQLTWRSAAPNVRPFSPRGLAGTGAFSAIWMAGRYPSYTQFQTGIVALR